MDTIPLILPGHVVDEYEGGIEHDIAVAQSFNKLLRALDPQLRLFWVKPDATSFTDPGRWHIARVHEHNPELNTYFVIHDGTPAKGYAAPSDKDIEALKAIDVSTGQRTYSQIEGARTAKQKAREKAFEEKRRQFRETLTERISHLYDPKVSITGAMKDKIDLLPSAPPSPKTLVLPSGADR